VTTWHRRDLVRVQDSRPNQILKAFEKLPAPITAFPLKVYG
jgi:hypothetical protein